MDCSTVKLQNDQNDQNENSIGVLIIDEGVPDADDKMDVTVEMKREVVHEVKHIDEHDDKTGSTNPMTFSTINEQPFQIKIKMDNTTKAKTKYDITDILADININNKIIQQKALLKKGRYLLSKIYSQQKQFISQTAFIFTEQTNKFEKMKMNNNYNLDFEVVNKTRAELKTTMLKLNNNIKKLNDFKVNQPCNGEICEKYENNKFHTKILVSRHHAISNNYSIIESNFNKLLLMNSQFINNNMREQTVNNQPQLLHQQPKANNSIQLLNNASQPQLRESNVYQNQLIQTHQPQLIVWHQQPLNTCHQQQLLNTCHQQTSNINNQHSFVNKNQMINYNQYKQPQIPVLHYQQPLNTSHQIHQQQFMQTIVKQNQITSNCQFRTIACKSSTINELLQQQKLNHNNLIQHQNEQHSQHMQQQQHYRHGLKSLNNNINY